MITNRGVKVWPKGLNETFCTDHWRCRLVSQNNGISNISVNWMLIKCLSEAGVDVVKTENLYLFDGEKGYSPGQGQ
jgi:isocitrate dehydrogenase